MATKRLTIDGYGQVELNNVAFRRDGRIEAQYPVDAAQFAGKFVENGMLLGVDAVNKTLKLADGKLPVVLVYSAEHCYDDKNGLKDFKLNPTGDHLPRCGYLSVGDKYTTNCICYDDGEFENDDALIEALGAIKTTALYGKTDATGALAITKTAPEAGVKLVAIEKTTMPDGQLGVKFQVIAD